MYTALLPAWVTCGIIVFIDIARYGQMTAGSYCYIGPQGIVHGTVVRNWGKIYLLIAVGGGRPLQCLVTGAAWTAVRGCSDYQRNSHCLLLKKLVSFYSVHDILSRKQTWRNLLSRSQSEITSSYSKWSMNWPKGTECQLDVGNKCLWVPLTVLLANSHVL